MVVIKIRICCFIGAAPRIEKWIKNSIALVQIMNINFVIVLISVWIPLLTICNFPRVPAHILDMYINSVIYLFIISAIQEQEICPPEILSFVFEGLVQILRRSYFYSHRYGHVLQCFYLWYAEVLFPFSREMRISCYLVLAVQRSSSCS